MNDICNIIAAKDVGLSFRDSLCPGSIADTFKGEL